MSEMAPEEIYEGEPDFPRSQTIGEGLQDDLDDAEVGDEPDN